MPIDYKNRSHIQNADPKLAEALDDIMGRVQDTMTATNVSVGGQITPPQAPSSLTVNAAHGIFDAEISDDSQSINRGINYFLEYSESPSFTKPTVVDLGASRNYRANLGNKALYWRSYSSYPTSSRSDHTYHGSKAQPVAVQGGGTSSGPGIGISHGSGTSKGSDPADGGFGTQPFRGNQRPTG